MKLEDVWVVQVETTNRCNAACVFCPHKKYTEFGDMSDETFKTIVDGCEDLPNLKCFIPCLNGDPFCDDKILDRIRMVRESLPSVNIRIITNGSLLTPEAVRVIGETRNIDLSVSINALTPKTHVKVTGVKGKFKHIIEMIRLSKKLGIRVTTTMVNAPEIPQDEVERFIDAGGFVIRYANWAGEMYDYENVRRDVCERLKHYLTVLYTGQIVACCWDRVGKSYFGDISDSPIEEIWNGLERLDFVDLHKMGGQRHIELCKNCRN